MKNYSHPFAPVLLLAMTGVAAAVVAEPERSGPQPASWDTHPVAASLPAVEPSAELVNHVVQRYCSRCHGQRRQSGNLSLESFTLESAGQHGEIAEKMIRKLRAGMMPPPSSRRPSADSLEAMVVALESHMDELAAGNPNPGSRMFQRLNRAEYQAAVWDLLGVEVDVGAFLPPDTKSANFDNIADVQTPSVTLMEGYLRAAFQITHAALGDPGAGVTSTPYSVPRTMSQKERVEGAPMGTRGGTSVVHTFPADGKYVFEVILHAAPEGELFGRVQRGEQVEVSVDGERMAVMEIDPWMSQSDPMGMTLRSDSVFVRAGQRRVTAAFIKQFEGPVDDLITPQDHTLADTQIGLDYGITTLPHLQTFTVVGPYDPSGVSETDTRRRIFTCRPTAPEEARPCAESILSAVAERAYRRPLTERDLDGLMVFYGQGEEQAGFEGGIRLALQAVLTSPHFVFRTERTGQAANGDVYAISDVDLASRVSFFLWGTLPDDELLDLAQAGDLSDPAVLEGQVRRMLEDPRSEALATRFAAQWLRLGDLEKVHPDALDYPYYDHTLTEAMRRETELFFDNLVREDRNVLELITADYTFVNERLARHYQIPDVSGADFRKVSYPYDYRRGLLGHGSILTQTSHANRTSPVLRGKWVMEVLMGAPPPPPPPDVPDLEATEGVEEGRTLTVRERMEQHRANPTCNSCHQFIDPLGLALEVFDVTGARRTKDELNPVDPVGQMYDGTTLTGPADLRDALMKRPDVFLRTFTDNLMAYALGRRVEYYDQPSVRAITRQAGRNGYRISDFVVGVALSPAFRSARAQVTEQDGGVQ